MRTASILLLGTLLAGPMIVGCGDKAVENEHSKSTNPLTGTTTTKDETTYQRPDGSKYTETQEHKSN